MYFLNNTVSRTLLAVFGFLGAVFAPPWVPLVAMVLLAIGFRAWEVPVLGVVMDLLWLPGSFFLPLPLFTIAALIIVWGLEPLRNEFLV